MKRIETIRTENFRFLLEQFGYAKMIAATGKTQPQLTRWAKNYKSNVTGKPNYISSGSCRMVEKSMGLPEYWMDVDHSEPVRKEGYVPVVSWVAAGKWTGMDDQSVEPMEWLSCPLTHSDRSYALVVRGISMTNPGGRPSFHEGDIIYVDPEKDAKHKDFVVVRLDDQSEATFKQLIIEDGKRMLFALNPDWTPRLQEITESATICGVVIGKVERL
nr:MAG TPA: SOS-response transcriptional repressors (RecA-mediated autopeptidases) [Caudoviricetes sp.]